MKYPEYDSPLNFITTKIATQVAKDLDGMCVKALKSASVDLDEGKLLEILRGDSERYREAFRRGQKTGYQERDEEIVRCKDCRYLRKEEKAMVANQYCSNLHRAVTNDWFCADGERE